MKIVVDTNIIFSIILNSNTTIGDLLFNSGNSFQFYSCNYMRYEIQKHWERLKKISKLPEEKLQVSYIQVLSKIKFINEEMIPVSIWLDAEEITKNIDTNDIDFVALTEFLNASLWTGDKILCNGLIELNFKKVVNTAELVALRNTGIER